MRRAEEGWILLLSAIASCPWSICKSSAACLIYWLLENSRHGWTSLYLLSSWLCRSLYLNSSSIELLALAGPNLQRLSISPTGAEFRAMDVAALAKFTSLTSLHLYHYRSSSAEPRPLSNSNLRELSLTYALGSETLLTTPASLSALETLHIVEDWHVFRDFCDQLQRQEPEVQQKAQQLRQVGEILQSLPRLESMKGTSKLFTVGLVEQRNGWAKQKKSSRGSGTCRFYCCTDCFCFCYQTWKRHD